MPRTLYDAVGGDAGLRRLAEAWHARVLADEVVAHAFHGGTLPDHTQRLAAYWAAALGGPDDYTGRYSDETSVIRLHSGEGVHEEMDRRAIACFDAALDDVGITDPARAALHDYFAWVTTVSMTRYPHGRESVPDLGSIPRWGWDGLERA